MNIFSIIPIGFAIACGWWLWRCGTKAGVRIPVKIVLAILGGALFIFGQYGIYLFLEANFRRQLMYYLTHYPDAYTLIVIYCIMFALVLLVGWFIKKTLSRNQPTQG